MARTSEMKLHQYNVTQRDGYVITIAYFYDTHERLWTAYEMDCCGNQKGSCEYSHNAINAIQFALMEIK
jgi:hypothetical protein